HPRSNTSNDIWIYSIPDRKATVFLQTPFNETHPTLSPDGRWMAYTSDESGRNEVYVQPFPGPGGKWQVSTGGGETAKWRRDGKELFYVAPDGKMKAAPVKADATFEAALPQPLFE